MGRSNMNIKELQKKWKYHRDCYVRARKKVKQYVPSGSAATSTNLKSSYRFFELMRLLDDTLQITSTISTLSKTVEKPLDIEEKESAASGYTQQNISSALFDAELSDVCSDEPDVCSQTSTVPSSEYLSASTVNSSKKRRKEYNVSQELQTALLDVLKMPIPDIDAIDGFLKTLGEALRRLPYQKRVMLQITFLQMTTAAEFQDCDDNY